MPNTDYFWTDLQQATERLRGSVVLYDDVPAYVEELEDSGEGPKAYVRIGNARDVTRKLLNSPKFARFRKLPNIGWMNCNDGSGARFVARTPVRSRTHGLANNNTVFKMFAGYELIADRKQISQEFASASFLEMHKGQYPRLSDILARITNGASIAYSRRYAVLCDELGLRWLYRDCDRVGLFTGADTLNLFKTTAFFREEIMEDPAFTLNNIREY